MINVHMRTIDGIDEGHDFDSKEDAFEFIYLYMGTSFEIGSSYAVNFFGDMTMTLDGMTWREYADMALDKKRNEA